MLASAGQREEWHAYSSERRQREVREMLRVETGSVPVGLTHTMDHGVSYEVVPDGEKGAPV